MRIAVLDDDITTLQIVEQAITGGDNVLHEPECRFFTRGLDMLAAIKTEHYDCLVLDRQLPDMNGDVILQWVRQFGLAKYKRYTNVIMLTHLRTEADELYGLQAGADDYLSKPFKPAVLVQRIQNLYAMNQAIAHNSTQNFQPEVAQPHSSAPIERPEISVLSGFEFNSFKRSVTLPSGELVSLSRLEFDLAGFLFAHAGIRLTREAILSNVWGVTKSNSRVLDTHIHRLRAQLKLVPQNGFDLRTIYGIGYCLYVAHK